MERSFAVAVPQLLRYNQEIIGRNHADHRSVGVRDRQVVNLRNNGTLPFLADNAVIEVSATIGANGPVPLPVAPVSPLMSGLIAHASAYEELAVEAALHGGRDRVHRALLAHPLVGQYDLAGQLTDRLLAENARFLSWASQE